MEKYAQMSISLLKKDKQEDILNDQEVNDVTGHNMLSTRLSRVLNDSLSDNNIREIFTNLEERFEKSPKAMCPI